MVVVIGCRWRFDLSSLVGGGRTLAEAFSVHFEDGRMVDQAVDGGDGRNVSTTLRQWPLEFRLGFLRLALVG